MFCFRRPMETEEDLLVFIWSSGPLEFFDASPVLQPFSYFQYRVRAQNSKGSVLSQWASARTLQAKPKNMPAPTGTPTGELWLCWPVRALKNSLIMCSLTGAYSAYLKWSPPQQPNGVISRHRLVYRKHQKDPTLNSTAVAALTVEVKSQENIYHYHYTKGWFSFGVGVVFLSLKALHTYAKTRTPCTVTDVQIWTACSHSVYALF